MCIRLAILMPYLLDTLYILSSPQTAPGVGIIITIPISQMKKLKHGALCNCHVHSGTK